ncbi:DoxX family protein [Streptomyces roseirectus]|uniref:DoxX family protein n=1 Tax=Streptomyces roseirectus TaxID=2768066 RepID=A0A7H0INI7_9ACTN|nr:DoxX family protein [Streptomyces roseirectus]QNP74353.1 DoxX family protein [Streptomyces roseirectus]
MTTALAAAPFMRRAADHLGMPVRLYRVVGALEVAGVAGLLTGLTWVPLGVAAAIEPSRPPSWPCSP